MEVADEYCLKISAPEAFNKGRILVLKLLVSNCLIFTASRRPSNMLSKIVLSQSNLDLSTKSILQNIIKAPVFKSGFELAKHHLKGGRHTEAKSLLKDLTNKLNCDWRVFYRSCYFLTVIAKIENDELSFNHYKQLLDIANPQFPIAITEGVEWVFKAN